MTAAVGGENAMAMTVSIPAFGLPWVGATITEPTELLGEQLVTIGGRSQVAAVVSGGVAEGRARYRLMGGKGGWGATLKPKAYSDDAGVKVSTILTDAAAECGETVGALPTTRLGPHWARPSISAFELLNLLAPRAWYVDAAGVTQFGQRAQGVYTGDGTRVRIDEAAGVVELAVDEIDPELVPGVVVDGHPPATDVEYELEGKRLTCRVYWRAQRADKWAALFAAVFPWIRYLGTFEYRVVTQENERLNLQAVRVASGMPDLARVPVRPGVSGFKSTVTLGELVLVTFADVQTSGSSRPQVFAHDHADAPGWAPTLTQHGPTTVDFLASKTAFEALRSDYNTFKTTHVHGSGVGPTTPPTGASPLGPQQHTTKFKATIG